MEDVKCSISWCSLRREQSFSLHMCTHESNLQFFVPKYIPVFFSRHHNKHHSKSSSIPENWGLFLLTILHFRCVLKKSSFILTLAWWRLRGREAEEDMCYFSRLGFFVVNALRENWKGNDCLQCEAVFPLWRRRAQEDVLFARAPSLKASRYSLLATVTIWTYFLGFGTLFWDLGNEYFGRFYCLDELIKTGMIPPA